MDRPDRGIQLRLRALAKRQHRNNCIPWIRWRCAAATSAVCWATSRRVAGSIKQFWRYEVSDGNARCKPWSAIKWDCWCGYSAAAQWGRHFNIPLRWQHGPRYSSCWSYHCWINPARLQSRTDCPGVGWRRRSSDSRRQSTVKFRRRRTSRRGVWTQRSHRTRIRPHSWQVRCHG